MSDLFFFAWWRGNPLMSSFNSWDERDRTADGFRVRDRHRPAGGDGVERGAEVVRLRLLQFFRRGRVEIINSALVKGLSFEPPHHCFRSNSGLCSFRQQLFWIQQHWDLNFQHLGV